MPSQTRSSKAAAYPSSGGLETFISNFEQAWQSGEPPRLEDFLPRGPVERRSLLRELVHVELEIRLKAGQPARVEEYLTRFPELATPAEDLIELIVAEFRFRCRQESKPVVAAFLERFPHLREALAERLQEMAEATDVPGTSSPVPRGAPAADLPRVDGYEILKVLGQGGMGLVYLARHLSLKRLVALKMIRAAGLFSPEQLARFQNEAQSLARLSHPHIVQVYEIGAHAGSPYFSLELVEGGSLAGKLNGAPAPGQSAQMVATLARAIHAAHQAGVVHRDLKPANVLVTPTGELKITDFGLAKQLESDSAQTRTGEIMGTPCYMAPEQAGGKMKQIGPATDVYALGAILYELLTGRPPFKAATVLDTLEQVRLHDPVPLRQLQPKIPRDLEIICLKCLHKEPERRYGSAASLADDLQRFLGGESIHARPAGQAERAVKWARRHPARAVLLAAVAALLLGLVGYTIQRQHDYEEVKSERDRARKAESMALEREAEARVARYAAHMRLASQMLNAGDVFQLPDLLAPYQRPDGRSLTADNDCRGFEWWYLRQYGQEARPSLTAHDGWIHFMAYSADGHALITSGKSSDGVALAVWDLDRVKLRWRHKLWSNPWVSIAAFAPGEGLLAEITTDRTIALRDVATGRERRRLPPQVVARIALSPDGRRLITGTDWGGPLKVWDAATGKHRLVLPAATGPLAVAPDGRMLVVGGRTDAFRGLQGWDLETGKRLWEVPLSAGVVDLSWSTSGAYFLVITEGGEGAIWDAKERQPLSWPQPFRDVHSLAMSPDERTVATGEDDGRVRLWDVATRRLCGRYRWQANPIARLAFSPDGRSLAAANSEGVVYQMDAKACTVPEALQPGPAPAPQIPVWAPDGKTLAVGLRDNTIQLLDVPTRKVRAVLRCSRNFVVHAMVFSPDSRTLATVARGTRIVRLWDAADGRLKGTTAPESLPVEFLAFSPDGRRLAAAAGATVRLWDVSSLRGCGILETKFRILQTAFIPDRPYLVTAGEGGLQVWDLSTGQIPRQPRSFAHLEQPVRRLALSPDGRRIAIGGERNVGFWRLSHDGELSPDLQPLRAGRVLGLQFGRGGATLLTTIESGDAHIWDMPSGRDRTHVGASNPFGALSPDGNVLATIGRDWALQLWDLRTWRVSRLPGQSLGPVASLAFTTGNTLVTGSQLLSRLSTTKEWTATFQCVPLGSTSETVRFWNVATGREIIPSGLPPQETMALQTIVACSPDGRTVAAGGEDGSVYIWDLAKGKLLVRLFVSDRARNYVGVAETARALWSKTNPNFADQFEGVQSLAFSPDGRWLAAAGNRGSVRVWRTNDWNAPRTLPCDRGGGGWVAFAPDGSRLATSQGGQVRLWDPRTGELSGTLGMAEEGPILCGVFAPGGRLLATGSKDRIIRLWDVETGKVAERFVGHQDRVTALAFAPDGKTLASGSWDRTVRLWSMAAADAVAVLEGHSGKVQALAFSSDGQVLASGSDAGGDVGEVLLWRAKRP